MEAISTHSAICPTPGVALERLRAASRDAIGRIGKLEPLLIAGPVELDIVLRTRTVAEWLSYLPEVERLDAYTVRYRPDDIIALSRFLMFVTLARQSVAA